MGAWRPTDISDCELWLDASQGISLGTPPDVSTWYDQSGNANDAAQGTAAKCPHYVSSDSDLASRPSVDFDGSAHDIQVAWTHAASAYTFVAAIVMDQSSPSAVQYLIDVQTGRFILLTACDNKATWGVYKDAYAYAGAVTSGAQILAWSLDTVAFSMRKNGTPALHSHNPWANLAIGGTVALGSRYSEDSSWFDGAVGDFLAFDRVLTRHELELCENYLASKYGLTASLPPGHWGTSQQLPVGDWGTSGGPGYQTLVESIASGREARTALRSQTRGRFTVEYKVQTNTQLRALQAWFLAHRGQWKPFRYKDWGDYQATGQTPTGSGTSWQLVKVYTSGAATHTRTIRRPVPGTVVLYDGGAPIAATAYQVDYATGQVELDAAPAGALTADFEFDVQCRFDQDELQVSLDAYEIGSVQGLTLQEVDA